ncbi:MAG: hypothetical protein N4A54_12160 [Peptostreptococcaceae bacterium]|jgi:hypothetical protein|nr:hypothetical protein [Peptostreptococcaceae bacterium]
MCENLKSINIGSKVLTDKGLRSICPNVDEIYYTIENLRNTFKCNSKTLDNGKIHDNIISILGERGSGKTSVMLSIKNKLENDKVDTDIILPLISPELMENNDLLGWIIGYMHKYVKECGAIWKELGFNEKNKFIERVNKEINKNTNYKSSSYCNEKTENPVRETYKHLQNAYIKRKGEYKDVVGKQAYSNMDNFMDDIKDSLYSDVNVLNKFKRFIQTFILFKKEFAYIKRFYNSQNTNNCNSYSGNLHNKEIKEPLIHIFFDDMDLIQKNTLTILRDIFTYLLIPNVIIYISGDYDNFLEKITMDSLKEDNALVHSIYNDNFLKRKDMSVDQRKDMSVLERKNVLSYDFLKKLMSPKIRYKLKKYNLRGRMDFRPNQAEFDNDGNKKSEDNYERETQSLSQLLYNLTKLDKLDKLDKSTESTKLTEVNNWDDYAVIFDNKPRGLINVYSYLKELYKESIKLYNNEINDKIIERLFYKFEKLVNVLIDSNEVLQKYENVIGKYIYFNSDDIYKIDFDYDKLKMELDKNLDHIYNDDSTNDEKNKIILKEFIEIRIFYIFLYNLYNKLINKINKLKGDKKLKEIKIKFDRDLAIDDLRYSINKSITSINLVSNKMDLNQIIKLYYLLYDDFVNLNSYSDINILLRYMDVFYQVKTVAQKDSKEKEDNKNAKNKDDEASKDDNEFYKNIFKLIDDEIDMEWLNKISTQIKNCEDDYLNKAFEIIQTYLESLSETDKDKKLMKKELDYQKLNKKTLIKEITDKLYDVNEFSKLDKVKFDYTSLNKQLLALQTKEDSYYAFIYLLMYRLNHMQNINIDLNYFDKYLEDNKLKDNILKNILSIMEVYKEESEGINADNEYTNLLELIKLEKEIYDRGYNNKNIDQNINDYKTKIANVFKEKLTKEDIDDKEEELNDIVGNISKIYNVIKFIDKNENIELLEMLKEKHNYTMYNKIYDEKGKEIEEKDMDDKQLANTIYKIELDELSEIIKKLNNNSEDTSTQIKEEIYIKLIAMYESFTNDLKTLKDMIVDMNKIIIDGEIVQGYTSEYHELSLMDKEYYDLNELLKNMLNKLNDYIKLLEKNKELTYSSYYEYKRFESSKEELVITKEQIKSFTIKNTTDLLGKIKDFYILDSQMKLISTISKDTFEEDRINLDIENIFNENIVSDQKIQSNEIQTNSLERLSEDYFDKEKLLIIQQFLEGLLFDQKINPSNKIENMVKYDEADDYIANFDELLSASEIIEKPTLKRNIEYLREKAIIGINENEYARNLKELDKLLETSSFYVKSIKKTIDSDYKINDFDVLKIEKVSKLISISRIYIKAYEEYRKKLRKSSDTKEDKLKEAIDYVQKSEKEYSRLSKFIK